MVDILMNTDTLSIVGPPDVVTLVTETGATGPRGSLWFTGAGMPSELTIPDYDSLKVGDMYVDQNDGYIYQMILLPSNTLDWIKVGVSAAGADGDDGASAYEVAVANGFVGTEAAWLASLKGEQGDAAPLPVITATATTGEPGTAAEASVSGTYPNLSLDLTIPEGEQGDPGPANSLAIGTVTTGAAGSSASASITGDAPSQVLNLTIPRGNVGDPTAYELRGTGMPNGVVTASLGTYYTDTAGTNGAWRWLKTSGTGNTGWTVVVGDTGWRNADALLPAEFTGVFPKITWVRYRRVGQVVEWSINGISPTSGTVTLASFIPVGFRPYHTQCTTHFNGNVLRSTLEFKQGGDFSMAVYSSGYTTPRVTYTTTDPWPTTLPGTPA